MLTVQAFIIYIAKFIQVTSSKRDTPCSETEPIRTQSAVFLVFIGIWALEERGGQWGQSDQASQLTSPVIRSEVLEATTCIFL